MNAREKAEALAAQLFGMSDRKMLHEYYESEIVTLTSALTVPEGCVRTADGVDRKVLGTLPMTADGCVVGRDATFWTSNMAGHVFNRATGPHTYDIYVNPFETGEIWSTRNALESVLAAKKEPNDE